MSPALDEDDAALEATFCTGAPGSAAASGSVPSQVRRSLAWRLRARRRSCSRARASFSLTLDMASCLPTSYGEELPHRGIRMYAYMLEGHVRMGREEESRKDGGGKLMSFLTHELLRRCGGPFAVPPKKKRLRLNRGPKEKPRKTGWKCPLDADTNDTNTHRDQTMERYRYSIWFALLSGYQQEAGNRDEASREKGSNHEPIMALSMRL